MTVESIARALKARPSGSAWMAPCPAHDDRNPSLGLRGADGKVLVHCYAGCTQRDVIEALKPGFNLFSLMQLLKNPLRCLFGKPALTCTADDYGNGHIVLSLM
jgi:hypothetical protein